jgi:GTP pyrophosphokinase
VDGHIVPLTYTLESGHTVEIITTKEGGPSRDWISPHHGYIKTARARNRVRQWYRHLDYDQHVQAGRVILEREVQRLGIGKPNLDKLAGRFNFQKGDDVQAAIGRGELSVGQVVGAGGERQPVEAKKKVPIAPKPEGRTKGEVIVEGEDDLMTNMARCCKPVPPDSIVGYITRGRGVTVHREDCAVIMKMAGEQRERLISVAWSEQPTGSSYPVDVFVSARDRKGLLRDLSTLLTGEEVDVVGLSSRSDRKSDVAIMRFTLEISNIQQLSRVLNKVAQMPDVIEVRRQV